MKIKFEVSVDVQPYQNSVLGSTFMATAEVKVLESDRPVVRKEFRAGPHEARRETEAVSWATAWALDKLHFEKE